MEDTLHKLFDALEDMVDNLVLLEEMDSTHALSIRLIQQMDEEGLSLPPTLILALRQSSGQGRGERSWSSPPGGLYLNWATSHLDPESINFLPIAAATAACSAVVQLGLDQVRIKWPNDLVVGGGKLGGVLVHARRGETSWATVGLGVNLTATPGVDGGAPRPSTSLAMHIPETDFTSLLTAVASGFVKGLTEALENPVPALRVWTQYLIHAPGDPISVKLGSGDEVAGTFEGVTDEGFLRICCANGEHVVSSGDIIE